MSSLFSGLGGAPTTAPQGQASQTNNLFGSQAAVQSPQSSSTFANVGGSQPQQPSALFGSKTNHLGGTTSGGLFSNVGGTSSASGTSGSGTTLLGSMQTTASAAQQAHGLLATGNTTAAAQAPAGGSIFGPQTKSQYSAQASAAPGPPQYEKSTKGQPAFFDTLLEKGKRRQRSAESPGLGQLPSLQLGLGDIGRKVRQLGASSQVRGQNADSKAHYLLAASGINPGTTRRDLNGFQASTFAVADTQHKAPEWDPDTDKVINQMHQRMSEKMMAEATERSRQSFNRFLEENVDINMDRQRQRIMEHFGLVTQRGQDRDTIKGSSSFSGVSSFGKSTKRKGQGGPNESGVGSMKRSTFGRSSLQKSVIGTPTKSPGKATLFADQRESSTSTAAPNVSFPGEKQRKYAEKTRSLNQCRLRENPYPILHEYLGVETQYGGEVCLLELRGEDLCTDLASSRKPALWTPTELSSKL